MKIKSKTAVAINMFAYGITTIVSTTQEQIDWYFNEFKIQPDKKFGKGAGKDQLCAFLYQQIKREDAFFSSDIFNSEKYPSRWQEFLEDCIAFACIDSYLNNTAVPLVDNPQLVTLLNFMGDTGKINNLPSFSY
ncbi:MAG: hypothetical protein HEQ17_14845 [Limnohabitans sp.]|jgi:hypothetical protein|uniref:hypothetical protein n=1 Tax=Limnohabitans sp. TaxID=1907725 RepID=UPI0025E0D1F5|nr:hypothetical protein [Limnohabitans sp.]MCO4090136.1 hypothetical protein [Limnohabitans sp.]